MVQMPTAVMQLFHLCVSLQCRPGREEVEALPLSCDISSDGIDGVVGHEVVNIQTIQADLGIIALGIGIESAVHLHRSPTLTGNYISKILGTVSLHPPLGTETAGNAVVALHIAGQGGHDKVQPLGLCIELHIGKQT